MWRRQTADEPVGFGGTAPNERLGPECGAAGSPNCGGDDVDPPYIRDARDIVTWSQLGHQAGTKLAVTRFRGREACPRVRPANCGPGGPVRKKPKQLSGVHGIDTLRPQRIGRGPRRKLGGALPRDVSFLGRFAPIRSPGVPVRGRIPAGGGLAAPFRVVSERASRRSRSRANTRKSDAFPAVQAFSAPQPAVTTDSPLVRQPGAPVAKLLFVREFAFFAHVPGSPAAFVRPGQRRASRARLWISRNS